MTPFPKFAFPSAIACVLGFAGSFFLVEQDSPHGIQPHPRVLVSNDDGWDAEGLQSLAVELSTFCEVVVCAPAINQSGKSQASEMFGKGLTVTRVEIEGVEEAWSLAGTPADAVAYGLLELGGKRPFDCVVVGINAGANVGEISHYSGTVGGAMEAAGRGVLAVAVSQQSRSGFNQAARFTGRFLGKLLENGTRKGVVYSINVPRLKAGVSPPVVFSPMGGRYLNIRGFSMEEKGEEGFAVRAKLDFRAEAPAGSDTLAFLEGAITVTPLAWDWTHTEALASLKSWEGEWQE